MAKIERRHAQDLDDVRVMLERGLIDLGALRDYFDVIEPRLYRYPAVDATSFRKAVSDVVEGRLGR